MSVTRLSIVVIVLWLSACSRAVEPAYVSPETSPVTENTIVHEISHTLSDRVGIFWMHILDTEDNVTPPPGVFEASYFTGIVAQCTYLEKAGRITASGFQNCLTTFSDPASSSRFRSIACDDFPGDTPITPSNRISP